MVRVSMLCALVGGAISAQSTASCDTSSPTCLAGEQLLLQVAKARASSSISRSTVPGGVLGYPGTGMVHSNGLWCAIREPPSDWELKTCPGDGSLDVKVLSYNLYWWNLFDRHHGSHRSAGKLIAQTAGSEQYDLMAFQECDDRNRVLQDAYASGLQGGYETIDGGRAIAIAYRKSRWTLLSTDSVDVGEDSRAQYYGKRSALWARLQHRDGKTVFFMNHHGPLRVSEGGGCTGSATALNLLKVIADNAHVDDAIILVGDFNAQRHSSRIRRMDKHLNRLFTGKSMGGVDHVFSNCGGQGQTLGKGIGKYTSDHDAISAVIQV